MRYISTRTPLHALLATMRTDTLDWSLPALRQQFTVRTTLDDAALIHHQYLVGMFDGGQAVRDHQRGAV
ncbi:hypothetical protein KRM18_23480, partial [Xanthomonas hortorum pv. gardneri]